MLDNSQFRKKKEDLFWNNFSYIWIGLCIGMMIGASIIGFCITFNVGNTLSNSGLMYEKDCKVNLRDDLYHGLYNSCLDYLQQSINNTITYNNKLKPCACCGEFCQGLDCDMSKSYQIDSPNCKVNISQPKIICSNYTIQGDYYYCNIDDVIVIPNK